VLEKLPGPFHKSLSASQEQRLLHVCAYLSLTNKQTQARLRDLTPERPSVLPALFVKKPVVLPIQTRGGQSMRVPLCLVVFLCSIAAVGQTTIGSAGEPIRRTPDSTWTHDGPSNRIERFTPGESSVALGMKRPRPYFYSGMSLQGNGNAVVNYVVGSGIQQNTQQFLFDGYVEYNNTRNINDNTINNHSGRTRTIYAAPRFRLRNGWFFGGGARWSQLSTTNYVKQGWRPFVGGGKDWRIARLSADYLWTACEHVNRQGCLVPNGQCTNAVRGLDFKWFMPSPMSRSHVLFRMSLSTFWFHTTVTTLDPILARQQKGEIGIGSVLDYTLQLRF